jgi:hypothetical protein
MHDTTDTRRTEAEADRSHLRRRADRALVASYIHELSERHRAEVREDAAFDERDAQRASR